MNRTAFALRLGLGLALACAAGTAHGAPITGTFDLKYKDSKNDPFVSRFVSVILFDEEMGAFRRIGPAGLASTDTEWFANISGVATTQFDHTVAAPNGEANGFDVVPEYRSRAKIGNKFIEIHSAGAMDTPGGLYTFRGSQKNNVVANYAQSDALASNASSTERAFAALDIFVTGTRYANHLGTKDFKAKVIHPGSSDNAAFARPTAFPNEDGVPVYQIVAGSNHRWNNDVLLHELGHTVARTDGWNQSPGGAHSINDVTADTDNGRKLAYQEGWANYFGAAAQLWENGEAGAGKLPNTSRAVSARGTHRDSITEFVNEQAGAPWAYNLESNKGEVYSPVTPATKYGRPVGDRSELAISRILWDLMDGTGNSEGVADRVTLGHQGVYNLITTTINPTAPEADRRAAGTLAEFRKVVSDSTASPARRTDLMQIFAEQEAAPAAVRAARPGAPLTNGLPNWRSDAPETPFGGPQGDRSQSDLDPNVSLFGTFPTPSLTVPTITTVDTSLQLEWMGIENYTTWSIQFFKQSLSMAPSLGGSGDSGPTDETSIFDWDQIGAINNLTGFEAAPILGNRAFATDDATPIISLGLGLTDWSTFLNSLGATNADPVTLIWNIVGYNGDPLTDGVWGTALRVRVVPTPGAALLLAIASLTTRRRRRM